MLNTKTHVGEEKGSEQYWHCVEQGYICNHAISGGLCRKHSMQCGEVGSSTISCCVGSETCKYFWEKNKTKSKMLFFVGKRENLRWNSARPQLSFPVLTLLSRKKTEEIVERQKKNVGFAWTAIFKKTTLLPFLEILFVICQPINKHTVFLLTV